MTLTEARCLQVVVLPNTNLGSKECHLTEAKDFVKEEKMQRLDTMQNWFSCTIDPRFAPSPVSDNNSAT